MDPETMDSRAHGTSSAAAEAPSQPNSVSPVGQTDEPSDAWVLIASLVEDPEWPDPQLLESILATGDQAVEPLLAVLRSNPRGWPSKSVLDPVIGLLRMLAR